MAEYWATEEPPKRGKFILSGNFANYSIYETKDQRFIAVGALEEQFWRRFTENLGHPEWGDDYFEVIQDPDYRKKVAKLILTKTQEQWIKIFKNTSCCVTPVYSIPEAEKFMEERMISHIDGYKVIGNPLKLSLNPPIVPQRPAPSLGQDTETLLSELLNYKKGKINSLRDEGIIF